MKSPSISAIPSSQRVMPPALLLVSLCLLRGAAAALLSSQSSDDGTAARLPSVTARPAVTVSVPSRHLGLLRDTSSPYRRRHQRPGPGAPRANLTLTLGGRLLLSRQADSENSLSGPPLSRDDPAVSSGHTGQAEAPQDDGVTSPSVSGRHGRTRSALTTEHQSRRLPPEFLAFPVYWSNELSGRRAGESGGGGGGGGGGRKPALESPLADQIVTTTAAPRRRQTTPRPSPATRSAPVEMILPAPPAGCDAPGGPPARLVFRCRALRQLRQQTLQLRRQAAQRQAQQKLQRIIDLHLADVTDSLVSRARQPAPLELKRREPSSTSGTTPWHQSSRQGSPGTPTPRPFTELYFEDAIPLKARRVPQPLPAPRTVTKGTSLTPGKRRRPTTQRPRPVSASTPTTRRPEWVPVRVSAAGDSPVRAGSGTKSNSTRQGQDRGPGKSPHRETDRPQGQGRGPENSPDRDTDRPQGQGIGSEKSTHRETDRPQGQGRGPEYSPHRDTDRPQGQGIGSEKSTHRETDRPQGQGRGPSRWRTYSSASSNSIRTAPDKLDKYVIALIDPLSSKPAPLFTTTIVPAGGMPITQKGVIPGLLDIPARVYFTCRDRQPGFYGNPQTGCQVYHQCTADGKKYDYLCGVGTAFNAKTSTCDHWYNTSCDRS